MIKNLHIICYKWGTLYTSEEVNILRAMVARHLSVPHKFYCITDDNTGLDKDVIAVDLPYRDLPGNGPKIHTFSDGFLGLDNDQYVVSIDIDVVIVGSLDFLAEQEEAGFLVTRHRATNSNVRAHGAVYRVRVGSHRHIWDEFFADPKGLAEKFPGLNGNDFSEQGWLEYQFADKEMDYFPENKIIIYRKDCFARSPSYVLGRKAAQWGLTTARWGSARLPGNGEAIVSFSGKTNPRDVLNSHHGHLKQAPFVREFWHV